MYCCCSNHPQDDKNWGGGWQERTCLWWGRWGSSIHYSSNQLIVGFKGQGSENLPQWMNDSNNIFGIWCYHLMHIIQNYKNVTSHIQWIILFHPNSSEVIILMVTSKIYCSYEFETLKIRSFFLKDHENFLNMAAFFLWCLENQWCNFMGNILKNLMPKTCVFSDLLSCCVYSISSEGIIYEMLN